MCVWISRKASQEIVFFFWKNPFFPLKFVDISKKLRMFLRVNIVLLVLCVVSMASTSDEHWSYKNLTGNWTNELGSTCYFDASEDGTVSGYYITAVGNAHVEHPLVGGWIQGRKNPEVILFSFIVMWKNTDEDKGRSATAWNGQFFMDGGSSKIVTTWILVSEKEPSKMWKSTLINKDTFRPKTQ